MKNNLLLLLLFVSQIALPQAKEKLLTGQINTAQLVPEGVEIINMRTNKVSKSTAKGQFTIYASARDVLVFSSQNFEDGKKTITSEEFKQGKFAISMIPKVTQLDEVEVKGEKLANSELWDGAKEYTPAERRLRQAAKPTRLNQGLEISNDAIINAISGKSKRLRKELAVEKKEAYMEQIEESYMEEYYIENLGIPKDYVSGFKFFIVEDAAFIQTLDKRNKLSMDAVILELSQEYKQLLADEK